MKNISVLKKSFDLGSFLSSFLGILIVLALFNSQTTYAQWYGELGLNKIQIRYRLVAPMFDYWEFSNPSISSLWGVPSLW